MRCELFESIKNNLIAPFKDEFYILNLIKQLVKLTCLEQLGPA